jgi:2-polyprenyl-6-hydroxyphenyl methylase/3-demethylubiquinone-9 3-methyltransferase
MHRPFNRRITDVIPKNLICLWHDGTALEAAHFYARTFPESSVGTVRRAPGDYPSGKQGDVPTVAFTVAGIPCLGLDGGRTFMHRGRIDIAAIEAARRG